MDIAYQGNEKEVIQWCEQNIPHTSTSESKRSGFNSRQMVVYGVYTQHPVVFIRDEKYAMLFALRWS